MSLINFERDMFWTDYSARQNALLDDLNGDDVGVRNDGVVGQRHSHVQGTADITAGTGFDSYSFGCLILPPPDGDAVPYRFKGGAFATNGNAVAWGFGYLDGGTGSSVLRSRFIAGGNFCDEIVVVRPLTDGEANYGDPLCFFCSVVATSAGSARGGISVQRLISKPDQYGSAVS